MSDNGIPLTGHLQPKIDYSEHDTVNGVHAKKVIVLGSDGNQFLGGGFNLPTYDYFTVTTPNDTTEVYTFKSGGASGTQVAVVTLVYTANTKELLSSATKEV